MEWIILFNVLESVLASWFVSSLLYKKKSKWAYRILLFVITLSIISISNYINLYDMYLSSFVIITSISISYFFVSDDISKIIFVCCLESLIATYAVTLVVLLFPQTNGIISGLLARFIYFILAVIIMRIIKKESIDFNNYFYYILSLVVYIIHFLIQHLLQMYLVVGVKNIDFLISFILFLICILILMGSIIYISRLYKTREIYNELIQEQRNEEILSYLYNEVKLAKHDLKHDYNLIRHYINENDINSIKDMIGKKEEIIDDIPTLIYSQNTLLNTIINNKLIEAYAKNIVVQCHITVSPYMHIKDYDLNQLLSNILDNAIENCSAKGRIEIKIIQENELLHIQVCNSIKESSLNNNLRTKKDKRFHGFGLTSIQNICQKYHGKMKIKEERHKFYIQVTLLINV